MEQSWQIACKMTYVWGMSPNTAAMLCVLQKKKQSQLLLVPREQVSLQWPAWSNLCFSHYTLFRNVSAGDGGRNIRFKVPAALWDRRRTITIRPSNFSLTRPGGQNPGPDAPWSLPLLWDE